MQVPTTSVMNDDGVLEPRIRPIRLMESSAVALKLMPDTLWIEADRAAFSAVWSDELVSIPEFRDSTLHVVTGLLLLIWKFCHRTARGFVACKLMRASALSGAG